MRYRKENIREYIAAEISLGIHHSILSEIRYR